MQSFLAKSEKLFDFLRLAFDEPLIFDAIFSDETENFVTPAEPAAGEEVTFRLRCAKDNVDDAFIFFGGNQIAMTKAFSREMYDFYEARLIVTARTEYAYAIKKKESLFFYNKQGLRPSADSAYNFVIVPDFKTPDWAKGSVMYQIYVDRFCNGDEANDVVSNEYAYLGRAPKKISDWYSPVMPDDICNFYGGDLQGVINKLDYLSDLGVEAIYFTPLFVSPSNHKYDIQDYDYIDPHIGVIVEDGGEALTFENFRNRNATMYMTRTTNKANLEASNALLCKLIQLAHDRDIKIILDGVFNHCGAFNKWLDREGFYGNNGYPAGAYRDEHSLYHNYFLWYDSNWPNNDCYDGWWGHDNHPKLNYEGSPELYDYIMEVGKKWVSPPFNADGWRLDVAADIGSSPEFNHKFFKDFRTAVKSVRPDAIIMAERYGDPQLWLMGDEWDTVMNYDAFMEPITWFLTGMEKHSEHFEPGLLRNAIAFENAMRYNMSRMPYQSMIMAMNELSNHDHSRFLTRTNMTAGRLHTLGAAAAEQNLNLGIMYEAVTFQMTWPGAPTVYYGDEVGLCGWTDPDNRRPYPWGRENLELLNYHKKIIQLRKNNEALRLGSVEYLFCDYGIISYGRWNQDQRFVVALNNNDSHRVIKIPVWRIEAKGAMDIVLCTDVKGWVENNESLEIIGGCIEVTVPSFGSVVLKEK